MGVGVETAMLGNRVCRDGGGDRIHFLRTPSHCGILFKLPGAVPVGFIQILDSGDSELAYIVSEMGAS